MTYTSEGATGVVHDRLELYQRMWVLRLFDMALEEAHIDGLLNGAMQPAFGQEAVAVGATAALRPGDTICSAIPHFRLAERVGRALPVAPTIAEMIAPSHCAAGGSEKSEFVANWKHSLSSTSAFGQSILFAIGDAHLQSRAGEGNVTLCAIGIGDANSAEFEAAANIAVAWRLPVVFVVEDIRDASGRRKNGHVRECHGMSVLPVDGKNVGAVRDSVAQAVQKASAGEGLTLVNAVTYRTNHPCGVDPLVFAWRQLIGAGVSSGHLYEAEGRARHLVAELFAKVVLRADDTTSIGEPDPWSAAS